ncbi:MULTISPECIES: chlorophyll synthesis pathway protein BchC [unclassified Iodidimonas]|jgi:3-hydroxyethyl bacteriochlorophyllide a dehydrogenase|uniref:chlorophyll synthesis pathway protein BchC n=1 Tax=unclassified Iodidimonas TaxID=2626145 RepID=UPI002482A8E4|nr:MULTISPECIES: chlorophyll synthesis pathway protein BchC [unclassified Iodidimonas]
MESMAIVLEKPKQLGLRALPLVDPNDADLVVETRYSGISTGTERLLWSGDMPDFPGMGYPLVPGYESVGHVLEAGSATGYKTGDAVFVPGANCFGDVRGLFGGTASHLVVAADRCISLSKDRVGVDLGEQGILMALAATAYHAIFPKQPIEPLPDLIIGHGVLGRLIARLAVQAGGHPMVWELDAGRRGGGVGYQVVHPDDDPKTDYHSICDVSGDSAILDRLIARLAPGGIINLAGFYARPLSFSFPPAFMREARLRIAAQWTPDDLAAVMTLISSRALSLDDLITHRADIRQADDAYRTAFGDPACLKMILDWRSIR